MSKQQLKAEMSTTERELCGWGVPTWPNPMSIKLTEKGRFSCLQLAGGFGPLPSKELTAPGTGLRWRANRTAVGEAARGGGCGTVRIVRFAMPLPARQVLIDQKGKKHREMYFHGCNFIQKRRQNERENSFIHSGHRGKGSQVLHFF